VEPSAEPPAFRVPGQRSSVPVLAAVGALVLVGAVAALFALRDRGEPSEPAAEPAQSASADQLVAAPPPVGNAPDVAPQVSADAPGPSVTAPLSAEPVIQSQPKVALDRKLPAGKPKLADVKPTPAGKPKPADVRPKPAPSGQPVHHGVTSSGL
jgi:hypothetical protein